ncbi:MAG: ATP-binding protein, partial [Halobaculum sp.]
GKRGTGKSHTLGVLAEGLAAAPGVTPTVIDPMGEFGSLGEEHDPPRVRPDAIPPRAWPSLVGLDPTGAAGGLVWRAVARTDELDAALAALTESTEVDPSVVRVAHNHLERARRWGVFDSSGIDPARFTDPEPLVLNCAGLPEPATNAVCRAVARRCYERRVAGAGRRLPWLVVDESHVVFDGVAAPALDRLYTRGRTPGVSVVCATQRPAALPSVAVSQADLVVAHAVRSGADRDRLVAARPDAERLRDRIPDERGTAVVADDATETTVTVRVRDRRTTDGGASPRASDFADRDSADAGGSAASAAPDGE